MDFRLYVKHYGVLGMHWGIRKEEDLVGRHRSRSSSSGSSRGTSQTTTSNRRRSSSNSQVRRRGLSERQKRWLKIGAATALAGLAVYGGVRTGKLLKLSKLTKSQTPFLWESEAYTKVKVNRSALEFGDVNPLHTSDPKSWMYLPSNTNCGLTTIAKEVRSRGMQDYYARLNGEGMLPEHFARYFKLEKGSVTTIQLPKHLRSKESIPTDAAGRTQRGLEVKLEMQSHILKTFPEGSRGTIMLQHLSGGHAISFERRAKSVEFINPQNFEINMTELFGITFSKGGAFNNVYGGIKVVRLDNAPLKQEFLDEVLSTDILGAGFPGAHDARIIRAGEEVTDLFGGNLKFLKKNGIKFEPES